MPDLTEITDALDELGPAEVENPAGRVKARSIQEVRDALNKEDLDTAATKKNRGVRFTRLSNPGTG